MAKRVPTTKPRHLDKKRRFAVFKRDNFACQYCGRRPPDTMLVVDYLTPVSEGGTDDSDNLITACEACNQGSGYMEPLLDSKEREKAQEALEQTARMIHLIAVDGERTKKEDELIGPLREEWRSYSDDDGKQAPTASNWRSVLLQFSAQLNTESVRDAIAIAMQKIGLVGPLGKWKYFCGVCRKKIEEEERARNTVRIVFNSDAGALLRSISAEAFRAYTCMTTLFWRSPEGVLGELWNRNLLVLGVSPRWIASSLGCQEEDIIRYLEELIEKKWIAPVTNYQEGPTGIVSYKFGEWEGTPTGLGHREHLLVENIIIEETKGRIADEG